MIPQQAVFVRKGRKFFLVSLACAFGFILLVKLPGLHSSEALDKIRPFLPIEIFIITALMGGLILINLLDRPQSNRLYKLLTATGITGLLSIPFILYLRGNEHFLTGLEQLFQDIALLLNSIFVRTNNPDLNGARQLFQADILMKIYLELFLRSFLFDYFGLLTFFWWAGTLIGSRSLRKEPGIPKIIDFKLTDLYIWPVIGSLALVLLDILVGLGALGLIAWNTCLIFLFLFGLEGIGIIKFLFNKYRLPSGMKWLFGIAIFLLLLFPRVNLAVMIFIPGLGISEIWIKYRTKERS